jgi:RimJ/RimL family protein N-acetyltransferase
LLLLIYPKIVAANKKMNDGGTISFVFTDTPDKDPKKDLTRENEENDDDGDDDDDDDNDDDDGTLSEDESVDENNRHQNATTLWATAAQGGNNPGWQCSECLSKSPFGSLKCVSCEAANPNAPPPSITESSQGGGFAFAAASSSNPSATTFAFGFGPTDPTKPPPFAMPAFGATAGAAPSWAASANSISGGISPSPFGGGVAFGSGLPQTFGGVSSSGPASASTSASGAPALSFGGENGGSISLPTFNFARPVEASQTAAASVSAPTFNFARPVEASQTAAASVSAPTFNFARPVEASQTAAATFNFARPVEASQTAAATTSVLSTPTPTTAQLTPPSGSTGPSLIKALIPAVANDATLSSKLQTTSTSLSASLSTSFDSTPKPSIVSPPSGLLHSNQVFPLDSALPLQELSARGALKLKPEAASLSGRFITLEPYDDLLHLDGLAKALLGESYLGHPSYDAEMLIWRYLWGSPVNKVGLKERLSESANCPDRRLWALRLISNKELVGVIGLIANRPFDLVVEIGLVMITPAYQRSPVAADATFALLKHAFSLKYRRVEWKTNVHNKRSRQAAERMGFIQEGIFRNHMIVQGGANRDTAWYSMITEDWKSSKVRDQDEWLDSPAAKDLFETRKRELSM